MLAGADWWDWCRCSPATAGWESAGKPGLPLKPASDLFQEEPAAQTESFILTKSSDGYKNETIY